MSVAAICTPESFARVGYGGFATTRAGCFRRCEGGHGGHSVDGRAPLLAKLGQLPKGAHDVSSEPLFDQPVHHSFRRRIDQKAQALSGTGGKSH